MRDTRLLTKDILNALDRITLFTKDMTYESFVADEKTTNAVIFNFLVIGEAVKLLPEDVINSHPNVPWRQIAGMRDKLTHAYFSIDYELVWKTVTSILPAFRTTILTILEE